MPFPTPSAHPGQGMSRLRAAAAVAVLGLAPLALAAAPASAHDSTRATAHESTHDSPHSSKGGELCGVENGDSDGLDLVGTGHSTPQVHSGPYTFTYRVTTRHQGRFKVYVTKSGYDPAQPLTWSSLDLAHPVARAADATPSNGVYTFTGTLPERTGRQVLYAVWHRPDGSDGAEWFHSCADVDFGGTTPPSAPAPTTHRPDPAPTPSASAPPASKEVRIEAAAADPTAGHRAVGQRAQETPAPTTPPATTAPPAANSPVTTVTSLYLADTGTAPHTSYGAVVGAGVLALGSAALFLSVRQRSTGGDRGGR
ncbi:lytic polysaccharide monooxygenase [Streptomyces sp. SID4985]|uniref:lytic polysaccharide monooxygenase n=1 Tax=Streptomyces sp. SID4985 TaxID=2690292 RepID=UPI001F1A7394|nr:lytic polysaccharide monooxygenase [Streptomyces sp. SID4985]